MPESIPLWPSRDASLDHVQTPTLTPMLLDGTRAATPRPLVLVLPGGGYNHLAQHEAEPVGEVFNRLGMHAAVLRYRVNPNRHPAPLNDAQRAIRMIRAHANAWNVRPDAIAILGFSAGGHLAACASNHADRYTSPDDDLAAKHSSRPDASILCYAVLDAHRFPHVGSFKNLLGDPPPQNLLDTLDMPRHVSPNTPPAFLWHTTEDNAVPVGNSLAYAQALSDHGVPFALRVYPKGRHGIGLANAYADAQRWPEDAATFLETIFTPA